MQISIVTSLFNRLNVTRACLESLERTLRGWAYEVILIDDGSTDGTREFLRGLPDPPYRVILNESRRGFAANNNAGARLARGQLLCLLNNDTIVLPGWLEPMTRLARLVPDVACVGNVQREVIGGLIDHYGIFFDAHGIAKHAGKDAFTAPREPYLEWPAVTAACCVLRRDVFLKLGGFDEAFRNGYEDVDFCLRAHAQGFRHFVANRSTIYHHISASPGRKQHEEENLRLFQERWQTRLTTDYQDARTVSAQREQGWRYLRKHRWHPWRFNVFRLGQALERVWSPFAPSRQPELLARAILSWQDLLSRWRMRPSAKAELGEPATILMLAGQTARNPSRAGVPTLVRSLAGAFGRIQAPVRFVVWKSSDQSLALLPPEFSLGADAESRRFPVLPDARELSAPSLFSSSLAPCEDPFRDAPSLHRLPPGWAVPPRTWVLAPEPMYQDSAAPLLAYVRRHGWRLAVIFHDAAPTNEPQFYPFDLPHAHAVYMQANSGADVILPVSGFASTDWSLAAEAAGLPQPPRPICRPGADTALLERERSLATPAASGAIRILCVSSVAPRKNHRGLLKAFELAAEARPDLKLELCFVGEYRPSADNIEEAIHQAIDRRPGEITWYKRVEYAALGQFYQSCDFTVYPSELEGFGLPILESLWFNRPCVCADFGGMVETANGGGCLMVDVRDPQALAAAIVSMAASPDLRRELGAQALLRDLRSWDDYAAEVVKYLPMIDPALI